MRYLLTLLLTLTLSCGDESAKPNKNGEDQDLNLDNEVKKYSKKKVETKKKEVKKTSKKSETISKKTKKVSKK